MKTNTGQLGAVFSEKDGEMEWQCVSLVPQPATKKQVVKKVEQEKQYRIRVIFTSNDTGGMVKHHELEYEDAGTKAEVFKRFEEKVKGAFGSMHYGE